MTIQFTILLPSITWLHVIRHIHGEENLRKTVRTYIQLVYLLTWEISTMADKQPIYTPFFGSMGATAAIAFSGKKRKRSLWWWLIIHYHLLPVLRVEWTAYRGCFNGCHFPGLFCTKYSLQCLCTKLDKCIPL